MEIAYDHIQEEILAPDQSNRKGKEAEKPTESLNEEFQEAYRAISSSPWGVRFGSLIGTVKKQVYCAPLPFPSIPFLLPSSIQVGRPAPP
jgi:hypothetical protein